MENWGRFHAILSIHVVLCELMSAMVASRSLCPILSLSLPVSQVDEVWEKYPQIKEEVEKEIEEHQWFKDTK